MDYYKFASQPSFFQFLLEIDRSIAEEAHKKPCQHCGGKLDCGDFFRTGYGLPDNCDDELRRRFSFCCRAEGCRKRHTPESLRFMRSFGYATLVVVLLSAIYHGPSEGRTRALSSALKVSRQTIHRWIKWWREYFAVSPYWKAARGRLPSEYCNADPPVAIINSFSAANSNAKESLVSMLKFLAPFPN